MRIGSLFSGIGGLELGLERAGVGATAWQVEVDDGCREVLAQHWPSAARFADVREVGANNLLPVDLICGGFPCQDISNAGKRAGLAGARSGLWAEYARIVGELSPRFVVVENVAALALRGLDRVLADLAALGFDAWWDVVGAADAGAPHRRERLFIIGWRRVAHTDDEGQLQQSRPESEERRRPRDGRPSRGVGLADAYGAGLEVCLGVTGHARAECAAAQRNSAAIGAGPAEPGMGRSADGLPDRLDRWPARPGEQQHAWEPPRTASGVVRRAARIKQLGNAVVPQVAEAIGHVVLALDEALFGSAREVA